MSTHAPNPKHELYFGLFCFLLMFLLVMWLCSSCSGTRAVQKSSSESSLVDESQIEEAASTRKKQTVETEEEIDTTVKTKPDSSIGSKPLNNIVSGEPFVVETDGSKVTVEYNPVTGNLQASLQTKAQEHYVKIHKTSKTTAEQADTSSKTTANNIKKYDKEFQKVVSTKFNSIYLIIGGCALVLILGFVLYKKRSFFTRFIK
jgi:hypothetical protein